MAYQLILNSKEAKDILIPAIFTSEEDGNPDDYKIELSAIDDTVTITRENIRDV